MALRARQLLAAGVVAGFPVLALLQQAGEVLAAGVAEGWPVGEPEAGHGGVGPVCGQHGPWHRVGRGPGDQGLVGGPGVGFGDPVAAWPVAPPGLFALQFAE